ncbi:hypothetical protein IM660_13845 [Ruania alkalisoli]|uniref:Uncharacterized protein n=1 Tax=Ruania alkalisoli TaxID=2779775 RepID=A0A7M1SQB7_9MICO|nr:hypothetical protein [Ruania alkalisoli]QOR69740.1 hypothetical protein IM660_13845 [Ruania alkalisoli]
MATNRTGSESTFAGAFGAAIDNSGVTLTSLVTSMSERGIPMALATLSSWRSGARKPSGPRSVEAVTEMEDLLGLRAGQLTSLVLPPTRLGTVSPARVPVWEQDERTQIEETLATLGGGFGDARQLSANVVNDVGADGCVVRRSSRWLYQAVAPAVRRLPGILLPVEPATRAPVVDIVAGGSLGRQYLHPSGMVYGVVIELERPLNAGETTMVELDVDIPRGFPLGQAVDYHLTRSVRDLVIWTRFTPASLPVWIGEYEEHDGRRSLTDKQLRPGSSSVHQVRRDFGPGVLGLRWEMEDEDEP